MSKSKKAPVIRPEVVDVPEVVEAPPAPVVSRETILAQVESFVALLQGEHKKFEGVEHRLAKTAAAAVWGALYSIKRDFANQHGIDVNIDG